MEKGCVKNSSKLNGTRVREKKITRQRKIPIFNVLSSKFFINTPKRRNSIVDAQPDYLITCTFIAYFFTKKNKFLSSNNINISDDSFLFCIFHFAIFSKNIPLPNIIQYKFMYYMVQKLLDPIIFTPNFQCVKTAEKKPYIIHV